MKNNNNLSRIVPVAAALILVLAGFLRLDHNRKPEMKKAWEAYADGSAINISASTRTEDLSEFLYRAYYANDASEGDFIASHILSTLRESEHGLETIQDLRSRKYAFPLDSAGTWALWKHPNLMFRALGVKESLGQYAWIERLCEPMERPSRHDGIRYDTFTVKVKAGRHSLVPVREDIVICIKEYWNEFSSGYDGESCATRDSVWKYVLAEHGRVKLFLPHAGADGGRRYFSVMPIREGFEYGSPRPTFRNRFHRFSFVQRKATMPLFDRATFRKIISSGTITVRTPDEYRKTLFTSLATFILCWLVVLLILILSDKRKNRRTDYSLLAAVILLTGIGILVLFSLGNPLTSRLYGAEQIRGLVIGCVLLIAASEFNWIKAYNISYERHLGNPSTHGFGLAACALALAVILFFFGSGPAGAEGVKINLRILGFNFQLGPAIKYLLLLYFAAFFAGRYDLIEEPISDAWSAKRHYRLVWRLFFLILTVVGIQVFLLNDMGPALCLMLTAVVLYSIARKQTVSLVAGTALYLGLVSLASWKLGVTGGIAATAAWFVLWYGGGKLVGKVSESPMLLAVIIAGVLYGGTMIRPFNQDAADRLDDRVAMMQSPFDNETSGQVAQGIWAINSAGATGSLGMGMSSAIPVAESDMIFPAACENLGLMGGFAILLFFGVILIASFRIGNMTGRPYGFFLCALIGLSLSMQALVIIMGSLGLVPLSGVVLPFCSHSSSALLLDLMAIGVLLGLARQWDPAMEAKHTSRYARYAATGIVLFIMLAGAVGITLLDYAFVRRNKLAVKPALLATDGERTVSYNPRVLAVAGSMKMGDVTDRNGIILSTSDRQKALCDSSLAVYESMGFNREDIIRKAFNCGRIYPCDPYTFFFTGDYNERILWGGAGVRGMGVLADERYLSVLRGFDNHPARMAVTTSRHTSRYLPVDRKERAQYRWVYDYSPLLPVLFKKGWKEDGWKAPEPKTLALTMDAKLQVDLTRRIDSYVSKDRSGEKSHFTDRTRIGVCVMCGPGDLLASACWPLADASLIRAKALNKEYVYRDDLMEGFKAYTDRDLCLSYATPPGSIIKIFVAGAGMLKFSASELSSDSFAQMVYSDEVVDVSLGERTGRIPMKLAIVTSSNVYFIKLLNHYDLYRQFGGLLWATGIGVGREIPYYLYPEQEALPKESFDRAVEKARSEGTAAYEAYIKSEKRHRMIDGPFQMAWGQGRLNATPAAICRYTLAVGNHGVMMRPRYTMQDTVAVHSRLLSSEQADTLFSCMQAQAGRRFDKYVSTIGGKTGTPVRVDRMNTNPSARGLSNDALYTAVMQGKDSKPIAVTVRIERCKGNSSVAMDLFLKAVLPALSEEGYI